MYSLTDRIELLFSSDDGAAAYASFLGAIERYSMESLIKTGVLLGLSGGPDSVMLLLMLLEYKKREAPTLPLLAVHINHGIRGELADRDELFSRELCEELSVEFKSVSFDVPSLARERGVGIEEAARQVRYSAFADIIEGRNDIGAIALAHNSTDNVETVVLNLLRGSGTRGMCGIPPVRDNILRPLILISKAEIISLLNKYSISYVIDETNAKDDYSRNYVRNNLLPHVARINSAYESTVMRMCDNMRSVQSLLSSLADDIVNKIGDEESFAVQTLRGLHPAVFAEVIRELCKGRGLPCPEVQHIDALSSMIDRDAFAVSLSGNVDFVCQRGICFFSKKDKKIESEVIFPLNYGENIIHGTNAVILIEDEDSVNKISTNIYNFSISARVKSGIIENGLFLRFKRDGDSYKYGGITRKLKKVFNDRNIPPFMRDDIPIVCDSEGILWVPGLPVRDGASAKSGERFVRITLALGDGERRLACALPFDNR